MTKLGAIVSSTDMTTEEAKPVLNGFDEATGQTTTAGSLEDVTGCTFDLVTTVTGRIVATLVVQCSASGGPVTGAWAISIDGTDGTEVQRYLSASNDTGVIAVQARSASKTAGTYTVKARHRRVSGASTVNTDTAQLSALFVAA